MTELNHYLELTDEFKKRIKAFKADMYQVYNKISKEETPKVDGTGRKIVDKRPDGFDYIIEAYMREKLDKHFPGWSWEAAAPMQVVLNYLIAQGHLTIIDEHLMAFGINPPYRKFYGVGGARIQFKRSLPLIPENVVDIDKNAKSADSAALKYAINRLTHIGDDVYGKRIEEEGAGSFEDTLKTNSGASSLGELMKQHRVLWGEALGILSVKSVDEITDFEEAWNKIKEAKGIK